MTSAYNEEIAIKSLSEDELCFSEYAENIAKSIEEIRVNESSFVIGLYGKWGKGKTSLINLIKLFLNIQPHETIDLAKHKELKNWSFGEIFNKILVSFVLIVLAIDLSSPKFWAYGLLLLPLFILWSINYKSLLNKIEPIVNILKDRWVKEKKITEDDYDFLSLDFDAWTFKDETQLIQQFFIQLKETLTCSNCNENIIEAGKQIELLGKLVGVSFLENAGNFLKLNSEENNNINLTKKQLINSLNKIDKRILVVIDNVDRLHKNEIRQIIKLIGFLSELPKLIFILPFDKKIIEEALGETHLNISKTNPIYEPSYKIDKEVQKSNYLSKIVNIEYYLPDISEEEFCSYIENQFDKFLEGVDFKKKNMDFYDSYYYELFRYTQKTVLDQRVFFELIKDARDAKKYFNTLRFLLNENAKKNLNIPDFMALTLIQIFKPEFYKKIKNNINILSINSNEIDGHILQTIKNNINHQSCFEASKEFFFLQDLFPVFYLNLNSEWDSQNGKHILDEERKNKFIEILSKKNENNLCQKDSAENYFKYGTNYESHYENEYESTDCQECDVGYKAFVIWNNRFDQIRNYNYGECIYCTAPHIECKKCGHIHSFSAPSINDVPEIINCACGKKLKLKKEIIMNETQNFI